MSDARFTVCIVIPIYNHKDVIGDTVARLSEHGLPLFVVDDGSDEATQTVLAALADLYREKLVLLRLPVNCGKGGAVMAGLRAARKAGYTHALQIDADGQHEANDLPLFIDAARANPGAVILGRPTYDESVPKSRLYGRYITRVWVWIETLSFTIRDPMCGFRLYPLDATCALIESVRLPARMEFDIEVLVRLYWRGVGFHSIPTRVIYPEGGVSHFNVVRDNIRISASHTRLVCGMLWRLPLLLARKLIPHSSAHGDDRTNWWRVAERGSGFGMLLLAQSCRLLGMRFTALWLHPIVLYFLLTGRTARAASRAYFTRLEQGGTDGRTPRPGWRSTYRQMLAFAQSGLDKLSAWSGRITSKDVLFDDASGLRTLVANKRGALVIGAHLGNLEMIRALALHTGHVKVTAIVYTQHAKRFNWVLSSVSSEFAKCIVQVSDFGPQTSIMMQERIDAGELLVIVGDRVPAHDAGRTIDVPFLGETAPFAQGPYVLAHALGCPVFLCFCLRERGVRGRNTYRVHVELFAERIDLPRRERAHHIAAWAERYARRLEHYCRLAPYQWFNFFDFWARPGNGMTAGRLDGDTNDRA
jgi:predicted LPLAT superfamily acyltransferase